MNKYARRGVTLIELLILFMLIIGPVIGALCWPYTINTWLVYAGKTPAIVWWQGALIGIVPGLGQFSVITAVLTWILMMFLA